MSAKGAVGNVLKFLGETAASVYSVRFVRIQRMLGASSLFKRISCAPDKETLYDYLAESRYALVFAGLCFEVEVDPLGEEGPDLRISRDGHTAIVEVARFRLMHPGPFLWDPSDGMEILSRYGNPERDVRKAVRKIYKKFSQLELGNSASILAIWNDDEDMEEIEVEEAVKDLANEASLPLGLHFVVYGSESIRDRQQLHCFPLCQTSQPHLTVWRKELASSTVNKFIQRALENASQPGTTGRRRLASKK